MSERVCPQCAREFGKETSFCPDDGTRLIGDPISALEGSVIEGRFTVRDLIATGGMGAVYVATQHSMGRDIALKVLRPELGRSVDAVKRFMAEARLASRLKCPHTVTLFDFGRTEDGMLFIAMELLEGATLRRVLEDGGPMDEARAARIAAQVCESLGEAHEQGIVHRDIKPDNVFLQRPGTLRETVKVLDFGVAKSLDPIAEGPVTRTGMVCGTPDYMSPENVTGEGVTPASDVYSVGVLLYQMLTGQTPFTADSLVGVMVHHVQTPPRPLRSLMGGRPLSKGMEQLVLRCLSKQPARRPVDANAMLRELARVEQERAAPDSGPRIKAAPCAVAPATPTIMGTEESVHALRRGRRWRVGVAVAVCGLALTVGVAAALWPDGAPPDGAQPSGAQAAVTQAEGAPASAPRPVSADPGEPTAPSGAERPGTADPAAVPPAPAAVAAAQEAPAEVLPEASPAETPAAGVPGAPADEGAPGGQPAPAVTPAAASSTSAAAGSASGADTAREAERVLVKVSSSPPGAEVLLGGRVVGTAPVDVPVPPKGRTVTLRLSGYEAAKVRLHADGPPHRTVKLVPDESTALKKAAGDGLR